MLHADNILDRISGLAEELKLANLHPQIAVCRNLYNGSQDIDVAVFGRFKAGKSSFLNHAFAAVKRWHQDTGHNVPDESIMNGLSCWCS
jgi:hypothetical protein